jgi:hypothetical protein
MGCEYLSDDNRTIDIDLDDELKMNLSHREIRVLLLHEFRLGRKATEANNNIRSKMGEDVLSTSVWRDHRESQLHGHGHSHSHGRDRDWKLVTAVTVTGS